MPMDEICLLCEKDQWNQKGLVEFVRGKDLLCGACRKSFDAYHQSILFDGIPMYIVYVYNDFLASSLFQFKSGDSKLAPIFFYGIEKKIKNKMKKRIGLIPPSTLKKTMERGFIPIESALNMYGIQVQSLFMKEDGYEQKKSKYRGEIKNHIHLLGEPKLSSYVLIDDVVTSGRTLKTCINLLREAGVSDIEIIVLSATDLFIEQYGNGIRENKNKKFKIIDRISCKYRER